MNDVSCDAAPPPLEVNYQANICLPLQSDRANLNISYSFFSGACMQQNYLQPLEWPALLCETDEPTPVPTAAVTFGCAASESEVSVLQWSDATCSDKSVDIDFISLTTTNDCLGYGTVLDQIRNESIYCKDFGGSDIYFDDILRPSPEPTSMPTPNQQPSRKPTPAPSTKPTPKPSPAPSLAPTISNVVQFNAELTLFNCSISSIQSNVSAFKKIMMYAIGKDLTGLGVTSSNINITSFGDAGADPVAQRRFLSLLSASSARGAKAAHFSLLSLTNVTAAFTIKTNIPGLSFNQIQSAFTASVSGGNFTSNLRAKAIAMGFPALSNTYSTSAGLLVANAPTAAPTSPPKKTPSIWDQIESFFDLIFHNQNYLIYFIVVAGVVFLCCIGCCIRIATRKRKPKFYDSQSVGAFVDSPDHFSFNPVATEDAGIAPEWLRESGESHLEAGHNTSSPALEDAANDGSHTKGFGKRTQRPNPFLIDNSNIDYKAKYDELQRENHRLRKALGGVKRELEVGQL